MSQENVELVRRVFASGEASAFYDLFDEDIHHDMSSHSLPDFFGVFHGREAVLDFYRRYWGTWAEYTAVAEEVLDAGDHVVIRVFERGRGKGSGIPFERRWYQVWTFRDGKVVYWRGFDDRDEALRAVGLSEEARSREDENVEAVRRALDALRRRDTASLADIFAEDGEWRPLMTAGGELERPVYRGPQGMAKYFADLDDLFEHTVIHIDSLDAVGPDRVLFSGRITARGRGSGVPLDERIWAIYEVQGGKLTRGTPYRSHEEAVEAVRLSE